jgi:hypothetical protein
MNRVLEHWQAWSKGCKSLAQLERGDAVTRDIVKNVYTTLSGLPWTGLTRSIGPFPDQDIIHLHTYLTTAWLGTIHENQMLGLLKEDLLDLEYEGDGIEIESAEFFGTLSSAYLYDKKKKYPYQKGRLMASGPVQYLVTIAHTWQVHWVPIIFDFHAKRILHGDSLRWELEPTAKAVLDWWTSTHTSAPFTYEKLPITHQEDSVSCGLLAWNAICHYFFPSVYPLIDLGDVAIERVKVFLRVCTHRKTLVSHV